MIAFIDSNGVERLINPEYIIQASPNADTPSWTDLVVDQDSGNGTPVTVTVKMRFEQVQCITSW